MAALETKMVKLDNLNPETLKAAWYRANVRDDAGAEYYIGQGWFICASDAPNPYEIDPAASIRAFYDADHAALYADEEHLFPYPYRAPAPAPAQDVLTADDFSDDSYKAPWMLM